MPPLKRELNPHFKKAQAEEIVKLIKSGESGASIGKKLRISRERISQVFFISTGQSIREYQQALALKECQELEKVKSFHSISPGCDWNIKKVLPKEKILFENYLNHFLSRGELARRWGFKKNRVSSYMRLIAYRLLYWHYRKGGKI